MHHNHPVTAEIAASYPENRRLTENERREIMDILLSAPDNLTLKRHIENRFGKSFSLNDVRQLKYRIKRKKMSEEDGNVCPSEHITHEGDFEIDPGPSMSWNDQQREHYQFAQFEPVTNELVGLVCSADHETFCERFELLKDLANAWRNGKQPMLAYNDSDLLPGDSLESLMNTEVVKTADSCLLSKSNRTSSGLLIKRFVWTVARVGTAGFSKTLMSILKNAVMRSPSGENYEFCYPFYQPDLISAVECARMAIELMTSEL
ncbi:hypothetical protein ACTXT7_014101 [Hymenolepis weldensis]